MNILLLGSGGREHALAWKLADSPRCENLYIAAGNAGTENYGLNVSIDITDIKALFRFIKEKEIKMLVVGPEVPLVDGLKNALFEEELAADFLFIGPDKIAAQLEGSKDFAKQFMQKYQIPTAAYQSFTSEEIQEAKAFLKSLKPPYVLKADGLAAGKGVLILDDISEAERALEEMLCEGKFGEAGSKVVIEEFLSGIEVSVFILTDGRNYVILPEAKDYKRIGEGDTGLNTGGMGSVSPVPFADARFMKKVEERIIKPTVEGIAKEKMDYRGFVFIGLMSVDGEPYVIEYNVRMGDPETESVIPRIKSDFVTVLEATALGKLENQDIQISPEYSVSIMLVSGGYPEKYEKEKEITGINTLPKDMLCFHAGTKKERNTILSNGGRVLAINARAETLKEAIDKAYQSAEKINFEGKYYRKDIGKDIL
jgi:phosphoribosylamine---glycine ligase